MKNLITRFVFLMIFFLSLPLFSQVYNEPVALGLPGDNFNLYAVLDVFQKSKTLEEFERAINDRDNNINNLDLNNDNFIDYVTVVSHKEGNTSLIVLRDLINEREFQDVAVIEVTKTSRGSIFIQVIGDVDLYGEDYIIEPSGALYTTRTPNPGYVYPNDYSVGVVSGNVSFYIDDWPIVVNLFSPSFRVYISPWYWGYYPVYWRPWAPIYYYNYWGFHHHYYRNDFYRRAVYVRYPVYYNNYFERRNVSPIVRDYRRSGTYNRTYEGRTFKRPTVPARMSDDGIRRDSKDFDKPRGVKSSTRKENQRTPERQAPPATRRENQRVPERQMPPATRKKNQRAPESQASPRTRPESKTAPERQVSPATRQENQGVPESQASPRTRQESKTAPERQAPPSARKENQRVLERQTSPATRKGNQRVPPERQAPPTSRPDRQIPPRTRPESKTASERQAPPTTRQESRTSVKRQAPPSASQSNRQVKNAERQSAREVRKSNPPEKRKDN